MTFEHRYNTGAFIQHYRCYSATTVSLNQLFPSYITYKVFWYEIYKSGLNKLTYFLRRYFNQLVFIPTIVVQGIYILM